MSEKLPREIVTGSDAYHCTGCYYNRGPVRADTRYITCCTCCGGPGRNDGGAW